MFFKLTWFGIKKNFWTLAMLGAEIFILVFTLTNVFSDYARKDVYCEFVGEFGEGYIARQDKYGDNLLNIEKIENIVSDAELGFIEENVHGAIGGKDIRCEFITPNLAHSVNFSVTEGGFDGYETDAVMLPPKMKSRFGIGESVTINTQRGNSVLTVCGYLDRFATMPSGREECLIMTEFSPKVVPSKIYFTNEDDAKKLTGLRYEKIAEIPFHYYSEPQLAVAVCVIVTAMAFSGVAGVALINLPKIKKQGLTKLALGCTRGMLIAENAAEKTFAFVVPTAIAGFISLFFSGGYFPVFTSGDIFKSLAIAVAVVVFIGAVEIIALARLTTRAVTKKNRRENPRKEEEYAKR